MKKPVQPRAAERTHDILVHGDVLAIELKAVRETLSQRMLPKSGRYLATLIWVTDRWIPVRQFRGTCRRGFRRNTG